LLGLPFFSMAMIAADAVFLPTGFLVWLGAGAVGRVGWGRGLGLGLGRGRGRRGGAGVADAEVAPVAVPVQAGPGGG
ncbi:HTTM domain-containing protein, partial [Streptomyces goshikiensis]